ncbi:hypothetical protein TanjilG_28025 [Lupinus angustifolius]|uniref:Transmembrane protein n=1 Tax=Lupinus angustifolius TaxID=3871 RepID=A0A4P1RGJ7_LUPAN|nr:PREDICTED: uncharacterized protein LOC109349542 [Lupinus angustifolius]OIW10274.1 hypothetical protein TanjilG_28025 [Lupinus angustifolius]
MATTPPPTLNFCTVLSESKRIINAHSRHFLALSVIFLLPLSFSLIVSPTLFHLLSPSSDSHIHILLRTPTLPLFHHHNHHRHLNTLLFSLPFSLSLILISLFSLSSITHSVFHGFFGRPVKLPSAIQSILPSFFPLLLTTLLSQLTLFSIALFSFLFVHSLYHFAPSLSSTFSILLFLLLFLPPFLYLQLSWTLSSVISVVESTYGFEPLNRSSKLMKGMKGIGLSSLLFFGFMEVVLVWSNSVFASNSDGDGGNGTSGLFKDWASVVQIVLASTSLMLLMLYQTAANTVLYMYCKAVHGELAVEIVEEFAREYVTLPFDEGKIPHLVSVVRV